jgi:Mg2+/Co2+ transporter CorC
MMKRQFRLIGLVALVVLSACNSKSKGPTDTYSSGVVSIAADESFEPIIQEEIEVFESLYPLAGIVPRYTTEVEAINLLREKNAYVLIVVDKCGKMSGIIGLKDITEIYTNIFDDTVLSKADTPFKNVVEVLKEL